MAFVDNDEIKRVDGRKGVAIIPVVVLKSCEELM